MAPGQIVTVFHIVTDCICVVTGCIVSDCNCIVTGHIVTDCGANADLMCSTLLLIVTVLLLARLLLTAVPVQT